jgi:hypothetical protein
MRLIYTKGFEDHERKEVRQVIFSNLVVAFKIICEEMRELGLKFRVEESSVSASLKSPIVLLTSIKKYEDVLLATDDIGINDTFPIECLGAMKGLWGDQAVQTTMKRGNEYALHDNLK